MKWHQTAKLMLMLSACLCSVRAMAAQVGFDSFTVETYLPADTFSAPNWIVADLVEGSGDALVAGELTNSYPTVLYNDADVLGQRIKYLYEPGSDDDLTGFVLGFQPGDTTDANAGYLLFDWKRVEQSFDFSDPAEAADFNNLTGESLAPASLRASWVNGVPTSDELWGKEDQAGNTFGGVTAIATGNNFGATGYGADASYVLEIEYTADQMRLFVDGVEEFNIVPSDIPSGPATFPQGRFGVYEAYQSPGSIYSQVDIRAVGDASAPDPMALPQPTFDFSGVKAAAIDVPVANDNAGSPWTVVASTSGQSTTFVTSGPNRADAELAFGSSNEPTTAPRVLLGLESPTAAPAQRTDGVLLATVRENGPRELVDPTTQEVSLVYGTVEAPMPSGFGGGAGIATANVLTGGEANVNVAVAFFPYEDGWSAGSVAADGTLVSSNGPVSVSQQTVPAPATQNGLYNVEIAGANSQTDGLLFTVGGSNNSRLTAAAPLDDGSWNVAVRDNFETGLVGSEEFVEDDFHFAYLPLSTPGLIGGLVSDIDSTTGDALLPVRAGDFQLIEEEAGKYRLSIAGKTPEDGLLLLSSTEAVMLADQTVAPTNHYLTYEADGDDFLIELRQTIDGAEPALASGGFAFAYIDYANPIAVPEPGSLALVLISFVALVGWRRLR